MKKLERLYVYATADCAAGLDGIIVNLREAEVWDALIR